MNANTRRTIRHLLPLVAILLGVLAGNAIDLDHFRHSPQGPIQTPLGRFDRTAGRPLHIPLLVWSFYFLLFTGALYTGLWFAGAIGTTLAILSRLRGWLGR